MTKPQRKALHQQVADLFARHNVTALFGRTEDESLTGGSTIHGTMPSPYGPVGVSFYNATDHRGHPWLACRLTAWVGSYPEHWYGWDHWKQSIQGFTGTPAQFISAANRHLTDFTLDQGCGFPTPAEIAATLAAKDEDWQAMAAELATL
ncbi:MAG: hypothetical protein WC718_00435 [Phycisphaerales bacterium]|jgi:hypothetical protein